MGRLAVDAPGVDADGWARARRRLRDLRGADVGLALGVLVVLLVPFVVSLVRAHHAGWVPNGDDANIATRALDVFSRHPPLTGLPSTSGLYGDKIATNHPGPIEFYLLAVPLRVLGQSAGMLLTAAAINGAFVLIAAWAFFRRLGLAAALLAGVLLAAVMWSAGTAVLADPLSSNMTMYSVLAASVLAWALVDGDLPLLPLGVFVASYAAQQHLAAGLIVAPLAAAVAVVLAVNVVTRVRRGDADTKRAAKKWSAIAAGVAAVCWLPVLYDQATGHPGNLTAIVRFARDGTRQKLGLASGFHQVADAIAPPSMLGRSDIRGTFFLTSPGAARVGLALVLVAGLALLALSAYRRARPVARLALVALLLLAAGVYNGSNVPKSSEAARINLYRWTWAAALLSWAALGLGVAMLAAWAARRGDRSWSRARRSVPVVLLVVAALISTATIFVHSHTDRIADTPEFAAEQRIADAVLAKVDRHRPVLVLETGADATLAVGPYVIFRLVRAGIRVEVTALTTTDYGNQRLYRAGSHPAVVLIASGSAQLPSGAGRFVAREPFGSGPTAAFDTLATTRTRLLGTLAGAAQGVKVELAPGSTALMARGSALQQYALATAIANLPQHPQSALANPDLLRLALAGALLAPRLDAPTVRALLSLPAAPARGIWGDDQVQARLLSVHDVGVGQLLPLAAT